MKATIKIAKSFDDGKQFTKEYNNGDFLEFFNEEGKYLERLATTLDEHGIKGDKFTVTYTVELVK